MLALKTIIGSTRDGRAADLVTPWVIGRARHHGAYFHDDAPVDPLSDVSLGIVLDDLSWWGTALQQARAAGELPPGSRCLRAAMAAATERR